jgi:hypothetical protein
VVALQKGDLVTRTSQAFGHGTADHAPAHDHDPSHTWK